MGRIILVIIFLNIFGCQNSTKNIRATIYYAPGLASYTFAVPCDLFEAAFEQSLIDTLAPGETSLVLEELVERIERLEIDPSKGRSDIDTRRKIYFHQGTSIREVCMGYVGDFEVDGQAMKGDDDLFNFMNDILEPELSK